MSSDRINALRAALLRLHMQSIIENVAAPDPFVAFVKEVTEQALAADSIFQAKVKA